jgi:Protein of unknown function (DUF3999)
MRWFALIALALLAACQGEKAAEPSGPDGFAFSAPVEPQGSNALQRIEVPAAALVAIKRQDLGDIRVFDSRGKALSIARLDGTAPGAQQSVTVPLYPIAGTAASRSRSPSRARPSRSRRAAARRAAIPPPRCSTPAQLWNRRSRCCSMPTCLRRCR